jgi:predicted amidophosphoribosyltransferase
VFCQHRFHRASDLRAVGAPLPYETGEAPLSAAAIARPPVYDRTRAAARYSETMRTLVQSFKYGDRHEG